jgi:hypothetical protein
MQEAILTVALSRSDQQYLTQLMKTSSSFHRNSGLKKEVQVLLCALREEMRLLELYLPAQSQSAVNPVLDPALDSAQQHHRNARDDIFSSSAVLFSAQSEQIDSTSLEQCVNTNSRLSSHPSSDSNAEDSVLFLRHRPYLVCCVRLSLEKEPHRFVQLVEELAKRGTFTAEHGDLALIPLLVGAATDDYAEVRLT